VRAEALKYVRKPAKIDIGPVFNVDPQKRAAYSALGADRVFAPVERELVFDVVRAASPRVGLTAFCACRLTPGSAQDLTDYDDVRTCCSGGAVCHMCWPFMTVLPVCA
jgi:DNA primase small subunit